MKSSKIIVSHIKNTPSLSHLKRVQSYKKLLSLLPPRLASGVKFAYNKGDTLYLALNHPGLKMEFDYKIDLIKRLLKELILQDSECKNIDAKKIKVFVSRKLTQEEKEKFLPNLYTKIEPNYSYKEVSFGEFKNLSNSKELFAVFEKIREAVLCLRKV